MASAMSKFKHQYLFHWVLHSEESTIVSILDQNERIVENGRSLALRKSYENLKIVTSLIQIYNFFTILLYSQQSFNLIMCTSMLQSFYPLSRILEDTPTTFHKKHFDLQKVSQEKPRILVTSLNKYQSTL